MQDTEAEERNLRWRSARKIEQQRGEQRQWDKIYDTFNTWTDEAPDDDGDDADGWTQDHGWGEDAGAAEQHFANFQFEIKKLSELYSGGGEEAATRQRLPRPRPRDEDRVQWSRAEVTPAPAPAPAPSKRLAPAPAPIRRLPPAGAGDPVLRMHRPQATSRRVLPAPAQVGR